MIIIVAIGGKAIMGGSMTIGDLTAFTNYIMVLVFPMIMIGFISNMLAQAEASYSRIKVILDSADPEEWGSNVFNFSNSINVFNVNLKLNNKNILKDVSFSIKKGSKVAIIGPTAAGKTQLFYLLSGLIKPTSGDIKFDNIDIYDYNKDSFYKSIGFVFQDSVIFNLSLRENIAFGNNVDKQSLDKAIKTAELSDFIDSLDDGLDTIITERGSNLSGGQKQRIMLARALAINPKILFLDDFTARVDNKTEQKIIANLREKYPDITLISITQKINPIKDYDDVILLMEGELLISGKHDELLSKSPEYAQIYQSQNSMNNYEIHA
jgi:ATP-binding cassette subfamily B protein